MKQKYRYISIVLFLFPLFLCGCSRDRQPLGMDDDDDINGNNIPPVQLVVSRSTAWDGDDLKTKFTPGCLFGVVVKGNATLSNVQYKYPDSGNQLVPVDGSVFKKKTSVMEIDAYYPYQSDGKYDTPSILANQNEGDNHYLSDALYAHGTVGSGNFNSSLKFGHRMSKVTFNFNEAVSDVQILNQPLKKGGAGNTINALQETGTKWKAMIIPDNKSLVVAFKKEGYPFKATLPTRKFEENKLYYCSIKVPEKLTVKLDKNVTINGDGIYDVIGDGQKSNHTININGNSTVYLKNVNIEAGAPIRIGGSPTIILEGNIMLKSTERGMPGLCLDINSNVVIKGSGSLNAIGAPLGPGIGTILTASKCNITIEDCTVNAIANDGIGGDANTTSAAGIGSRGGSGCGNITIKNATITAKGSYQGAGIGSGGSGGCGNITITLKSGQTKDQFLNGITAGRDAPNKVGAGAGGSCGTITWK